MKPQLQSATELTEMDYLRSNFRVNKDMKKKAYIKVGDLMSEQKRIHFLNHLTEMILSPSLKVTVSQFAKRYAFLVIGPSLYAMSMYDKSLDLSFENCRFDYTGKDGTCLANLHLYNFQITKRSDVEARKAWRDKIIKHIFADHITELWNVLAKSTKTPKSILWENAAIRIFSLYEKRMVDAPNDKRQKLIHEDFMYLITKAPGELFGEIRNPLTKFDRPKRCVNEKEPPIRIRKSCCFLYELEQGTYCKACPRIKR